MFNGTNDYFKDFLNFYPKQNKILPEGFWGEEWKCVDSEESNHNNDFYAYHFPPEILYVKHFGKFLSNNPQRCGSEQHSLLCINYMRCLNS